MATGEEFSPDLEALSREELTGPELREVLKRLSVAEFGGSDHPTVAAVCEATGASPLVVGRILAAIREERLQEVFGRRLSRHEEILEEQQQDISEIRSQLEAGVPPRRSAPPINIAEQQAQFFAREEYWREGLAEENDDLYMDSGRIASRFLAFIIVVIVVVTIVSALAKSQVAAAEADQWRDRPPVEYRWVPPDRVTR